MMKKYCGWIVLFFVIGCSENNISVPTYQAYFPLHVNRYWDYAVTQTTILQTTPCVDGGLTTQTFQLRAVVTDSVKNDAGGFNFILHRYTRTDDTQPWTDLDTWTARVTANAVIQNESNTSYVKMIFPLRDSLKWNGNLYNNLGTQSYSASAVGKSYQVNSASYPNTVIVYQSNYDDFFITRDIRHEVYGYNIGLLYKKVDQRTFFLDPCYGQQKVQKGLIYEQSLIGYGKL
jgi:hypothetical protein